MLTILTAERIYLAPGATDTRKAIDGLSAIVREAPGEDPVSGPTGPPVREPDHLEGELRRGSPSEQDEEEGRCREAGTRARLPATAPPAAA